MGHKERVMGKIEARNELDEMLGTFGDESLPS